MFDACLRRCLNQSIALPNLNMFINSSNLTSHLALLERQHIAIQEANQEPQEATFLRERLLEDGRFHLLIPYSFRAWPNASFHWAQKSKSKSHRLWRPAMVHRFQGNFDETCYLTSTLKISVTSSSSTKHKKRPAGSDISQVVGSSNQFYRYKQHALKPLGEDIGDYNHEIFIWIQYHCHWTAPFQLGFPKKRGVSKRPTCQPDSKLHSHGDLSIQE